MLTPERVLLCGSLTVPETRNDWASADNAKHWNKNTKRSKRMQDLYLRHLLEKRIFSI